MASTSYYQSIGWVINPNTGMYEPPRGNPDAYAIGFSGAQRPNSSVYTTSLNDAWQMNSSNNWDGGSAWTLWQTPENGSAWIPPTSGPVSAEANNAAVAASLGVGSDYVAPSGTNKAMLLIAAVAAYFIFK